MYIRYWSSTDNGPGSDTSLSYLRAILRFAPVRLISMSGVLIGPWRAMDSLLMTPMAGPMINVACARPDQWVQSIAVAMPKADAMHASLAKGETIPVKTESETIARELYTASAKRNVLIALDLPATTVQAKAANRYDVVLVPKAIDANAWAARCILQGVEPRLEQQVIFTPVPIAATAMRTFRTLVTLD